jgi:hypothetical protein
MKGNDIIILVLCLVAIFIIFFAWYLQRTCRRVWDVEVHEMQYQRAAEAMLKAGENGNAGGNANANAGVVTGNPT